ncbi:MAG: acyltransferase family protein [Methanosphaera sp.]|nr:acyltransferase family protein [Methanosphaera sp.]
MKFVKETTGQKRNLEIDIIRGIAMIFVLWGHSIQYCCVGYFDFFENFVFRFIYSFHMPLFIFISGYAFYWSCQKRYLRTILIKVIKGLGSSIIIWNTIQWIFSVILDLRKGNTLSIIGYVKWWISSLYGLWFLWSILIFSISVSLIYKKVNKLSIKLLLWFCVWITMVCLPDIIEPAKNCNIWLFPYFLSAFLFHEYQPKFEKYLNIQYLALPLFPIMLFFFHKRDYIYTSGINPFNSSYGVKIQIGIDLYRWMLGVVGSIFIITILLFIYSKTKSMKFWTLISNVGQNTLQIYVLQALILERIFSMIYAKITLTIDSNLLAKNMVLYNFVWTPLLTIILLVVFMVIISFMKKRLPKFSKFIFGR